MKDLCLLLCASLALSAGARTILLPAQSASSYPDTEVSTNIAINAGRDDPRRIGLRFRLEGMPSNDLEVVFGRDANTNGVLDAEEAGTVYGWRGGRYIVENVLAWERFETESVTNVPCGACDIHLKNGADLASESFTAVCDGTAAFQDFPTNPPPAWLYRPDWNMMRVTRRGTPPLSEWLDCRLSYRYFHLRVR